MKFVIQLENFDDSLKNGKVYVEVLPFTHTIFFYVNPKFH